MRTDDCVHLFDVYYRPNASLKFQKPAQYRRMNTSIFDQNHPSQRACRFVLVTCRAQDRVERSEDGWRPCLAPVPTAVGQQRRRKRFARSPRAAAGDGGMRSSGRHPTWPPGSRHLPGAFPASGPPPLVNLAVASVTPGLVARSGPTPSCPPLHLLVAPLRGRRYRAVSGRHERRIEKQNKQTRKMHCDTRSDYGTEHRPSASQWRVRISLLA